MKRGFKMGVDDVARNIYLALLGFTLNPTP